MPTLGEIPNVFTKKRDRSGELPNVHMRMTLEVRTALEKAAKVERRTISSMMDLILAKWLVAHGYLDEIVEHPKRAAKEG